MYMLIKYQYVHIDMDLLTTKAAFFGIVIIENIVACQNAIIPTENRKTSVKI